MNSSEDGLNNRWLIISYFSNMDGKASSHHIDDRIPYLRAKGIEVDLLTSICGERTKGVSTMRVISPAPSGIRYELRHLGRVRNKNGFRLKLLKTLFRIPILPLYLIERAFLRWDSTSSWFLTASVAATLCAIRKRPRVIYSTGGPASAHIAAMVASRITGIPFICEFQDPLVRQYTAPGRIESSIIHKVESMLFKRASAAIFLTKRAASAAVIRSRGTGRIFAIYPGACCSEDVFTEPSLHKGIDVERKGSVSFPLPTSHHSCGCTDNKADTLNVAHFGSLGRGRNLHFLLEALAVLLKRHPFLHDVLRISLYGNIDKKVRKQVEQFAYKEILDIKGEVSRKEAFERMCKSDVLLLIQHTNFLSFEAIPSKVYEYFQARRPILGLVYRNPELQTMLEEMGHIVVQADDSKAIAEGLEIYLERWRRGELKMSVVNSPYTVERAVNELIALVNDVSGGPSKR